MSKFKKEYVYDVEEYSQDTRRYQVVSNVKLTHDEVITIYQEGEKDKFVTDIQKNMDFDDKRFTDDEILNSIKVKSIFDGTEYGENCEVDITGDFENDE